MAVKNNNNPFEFGISEKIAQLVGRPTNNLIPNKAQAVAGALSPTAGLINVGATIARSAPKTNFGSNVLGIGAMAPPPSNGGQAPGYTSLPQTGNNNGYRPNTSGQTGADNNAPPPGDNGSGNNDNYMMDILRSNFANARSGIEALNPQLDNTYNTAKSDLDISIRDAENARNNQKGELESQFGSVLKNQLQTYQDLNRQRQGLYSSLGTLDSSSFGEQQFRADQNFATDRGTTEREKVKSLNAVDEQLNSYKERATNELSRLASQYQAGKQGIANALAQNNINEASALQEAVNQIDQRAYELKNNMREWAMQAAILKQQGVDVTGAIRGITGNQYAGNVANSLANQRAFGNSLIPQLIGLPQGQGYVGSGGGDRKKEQELLAGLR